MNMNARREIYETMVLFSVLFLPSYIQGTPPDPDIFNSVSFNLSYLILAVPKYFLLIYIISDKPRQYRITQFHSSSIFASLAVFALLWSSVLLLNQIYSRIPLPAFNEPAAQQWTITSWRILPLLFLVSITTGYLEEGFFRCYLFTQFSVLGASPLPAAVTVSLLFGLAHGYQGLAACITTTVMGLVLQYFREKTGSSVHPLAIGHGLYNFSIFFLAFFAS